MKTITYTIETDYDTTFTFRLEGKIIHQVMDCKGESSCGSNCLAFMRKLRNLEVLGLEFKGETLSSFLD